MNAAFEQVGRSLEAVQMSVVLDFWRLNDSLVSMFYRLCVWGIRACGHILMPFALDLYHD